MCAALAEHGIGPRKTRTLSALPELPEHLYGAYVRGVFDGDGTWSGLHAKGMIAWRLIGNRDYLLSVQDLMIRTLALNKTKLTAHHTTPYIALLNYGGTQQTIKICRWMYFGATTHLLRKTLRFVEYLRRYGYTAAEDFEALTPDV